MRKRIPLKVLMDICATSFFWLTIASSSVIAAEQVARAVHHARFEVCGPACGCAIAGEDVVFEGAIRRSRPHAE